MRPTLSFMFVLVVLVVCGCGNFSFRDAMRPDGKYDLSKLVAGLKTKQPEPLVEISWVPLIRLQVNSFHKIPDKVEGKAAATREPGDFFVGSERQPPGYSLSEVRSFGPLFAYVENRESFYDQSNNGYEVREVKVLLWRLWIKTRSLVQTPYGPREEKRNTFLFGLLDGFPSVTYFAKDSPDV